MKAVTKMGRDVYVAWREGEAEVWKPKPKRGTESGDLASCWEILGVPQSASKAEIQSAYRKLIQQHHPDKAAHLSEDKQKQAERDAQRLNEAYERAMTSATAE